MTHFYPFLIIMLRSLPLTPEKVQPPEKSKLKSEEKLKLKSEENSNLKSEEKVAAEKVKEISKPKTAAATNFCQTFFSLYRSSFKVSSNQIKCERKVTFKQGWIQMNKNQSWFQFSCNTVWMARVLWRTIQTIFDKQKYVNKAEIAFSLDQGQQNRPN